MLSIKEMLELLCLSDILNDFNNRGNVNVFPDTYKLIVDRYKKLTRDYLTYLNRNTQK